ncbi:MAG TPA: iron-containing alcohol dehydrogenase [Burkholderiaceae bacterium]|jgi:maleylacetate reductase
MELSHFTFPAGVERVVRGRPASEVVPELLDRFGYRRVFIVASRTLNRRTDVVRDIERQLGNRVVGLTDEVGEHAPINNVLAGARGVAACNADVILSFGGGSVLDFCKFVQLAVSEGAFTKPELLEYQMGMTPDGTEALCTSTAEPKVRQIAVPTTLAAAEWTPSGTPVDEVTRQKVRLRAVRGAPQAIVYDPAMLLHTPTKLLFATAIRGLDHAINSYTSVRPHPVVDLVSLEAVRLYFANLPRLAENPADLAALSGCQLATWYTGFGNATMSPLHGFSHFMVHVLAPFANVGHSETAAVLMLAQARWIEAVGTPHYATMLGAIGSKHARFSDALRELLETLKLPMTLDDLGVTPAHVEAALPLAMKHPMLMRHNVRPLRDENDLRAILALAR